jgi:hypothetical protein
MAKFVPRLQPSVPFQGQTVRKMFFLYILQKLFPFRRQLFEKEALKKKQKVIF